MLKLLFFLMDKAEVGKEGVGKSTLTLGKHLMFVGCTGSTLGEVGSGKTTFCKQLTDVWCG